MTRLSTSIVLVALFAAAAFLLVPMNQFGWAQQPSSGMGAPGSTTGGYGGGSGYGSEYGAGSEYGGDYGYGSGYGEEMYGMESDGPSALRSRLTQLTRKLKLAKTKDDKAQATKALEQLLGEYFDSDMKRRQAELVKVKQRIARLEALLDKRQTAKQEIVDLQLRTMVNETEGLGFFSTPTSSSSSNYGGSYGEYGGPGMEMMDGGGGMMGESMGDEMMGSGMVGSGEMSSGGMGMAPATETTEDESNPTDVPKD